MLYDRDTRKAHANTIKTDLDLIYFLVLLYLSVTVFNRDLRDLVLLAESDLMETTEPASVKASISLSYASYLTELLLIFSKLKPKANELCEHFTSLIIEQSAFLLYIYISIFIRRLINTRASHRIE